MKSAFLDQLNNVLGPKGLSIDAETLAPWLTDWRGRWRGRALALVSPASTQEVAQVVALAAAARVPIVPQGGNTSMVGGATPDDTGQAIILSLRRMNQIRRLDAIAGLVVAEAGVVLATLHEAALGQDMRFPLSLGAKGSATIGGLVSTNAGGTQVLRFGTMRALTLGLELVLPSGAIIEGLSPLKKDNRGYDFTQLMIGAEGTLGVVTAATLRLVPAATNHATAWLGVKSAHLALTLLRFLEARTDQAIESFELIPTGSLQLVLTHIPQTRAPLAGQHMWHVLVDYKGRAGDVPAETALTQLIEQAYAQGLVEDAVIATSTAQAQAFWKLRESISEAERAEGAALQHDISVPVDDMPRFIESASAQIEAEFPGVTARAFGHLGDGNVHFHVCAPKGIDGPMWRESQGKAISARVHDLVAAANGSLSAEHGIGQMKRVELLRLTDPARIAAMRAIKVALDPHEIMNPGKLIPLASDALAQ